MPYFVANGPPQPQPGTGSAILVGRDTYGSREEADEAARLGAAEQERAGYGGGRTIVVEAESYADALEIAHVELTGRRLHMPEEARRRLREAMDGDVPPPSP
jgi:hypothetical protein